jgi:homocysteine S-methyltransferase
MTKLSIASSSSNNVLLLLDGGVATELEFQGCILDKELWSALLVQKNPLAVKNVHRLYLQHGSNIITTCSYQFNFDTFENKKHYSHEEAKYIFLDSIRLACEARDEFSPNALVAASMSCYGSVIGSEEFSGSYVDTMENCDNIIRDFHWSKIQCILELFNNNSNSRNVPDILLFETIPVLREAILVCELFEQYLLKNDAGGLPFDLVFSFSCKDGIHTCHGEEISECARQLSQYPFVNGIGINCYQPKYTASLVQHIDQVIGNREESQLNLFVYPNNGDVWDGEKWQPSNDGINYEKQYGKYLVEQVLSGISKQTYTIVIGGCCKVRPCHIQLLHNHIVVCENLLPH